MTSSQSPTVATIYRGAASFRLLVEKLRSERFGCYLVWIHDHKVAKIAKVGRPQRLDQASSEGD